MGVHRGGGGHEDVLLLHHPVHGAGGGGLPGPPGALGQVLTAGPADGLTEGNYLLFIYHSSQFLNLSSEF